MQIALMNIDPAKVEMRSRDTEANAQPGPWTDWQPLTALQDVSAAYMVAYLAASQLIAASNSAAGTVTISIAVTQPDGTPIRTIDCALRTS